METTVDTLNQGDTLLVSYRGVKGGKIQLEIAEHIRSPFAKAGNSLVSAFNKSDERFSSRPRRAWISGEKEDIQELLGEKLADVREGTTKVLNILNPKVKGLKLRVQVNETTEPDDYQKDNIEDTAKKAGSEGDFIYYKGKHIYSNTSVIQGEPEHTWLPGDSDQDATSAEESAEESYEAPEELTA